MTISRRSVLKCLPLLAWPGRGVFAAEPGPQSVFLGQGSLCGEVTDSSALLQTRLTAATQLDADGDLPGAAGVACFEWSSREDFRDARRTRFLPATDRDDFIVRAELTGLKPDTAYHYRVVYGRIESAAQLGPHGSFRTLSGREHDTPARFIVGSCMNYNKFMHGRAGRAGGPLTATAMDKRLGYPAFEAMLQLRPDFFVGTGDIVYYDNPMRVAKTIPQLRKCWHEQFRFPRLIEFFRAVPAYWSKDDHDFRYNESDNTTEALPLPKTGIDMFREQLPILAAGSGKPTYRTHRVSRKLQIWLTENRDYRSPNAMADSPQKSIWGAEQREWLKATLKASDARWKILISPTPMVGPDDRQKVDNHADIRGFRHEADAFFAWLQENRIGNLTVVCGDRHWQYHSIHPSGVEEFGCGALNDENARLGVAPGAKNSSDPEGRIKQHYTSPTPNGGFLQITADTRLTLEHFDSRGKSLYRTSR
ncbi:MAG: alkaline phosphatase D family protein [Opitutaceae bacterium]|nr:alkaline phosphatase D family protein [Opitutaceae bacterium]